MTAPVRTVEPDVQVARSSRVYRRSPSVLLYWEAGRLCALQADPYRLFHGAERYVDYLLSLDLWTTADQVAANVGDADIMRVTSALDRLVSMGLVQSASEPSSDSRLQGWNLIELAVQRQVATGGARVEPAPTTTPAPATFKPPSGVCIALPDRPLPDSARLGTALANRRTGRRYRDASLSLDGLGTFLAATARATPRGTGWRRPYPSGGGRYPLEVYPVCNDVAALEPGLYHYAPKEHALVQATGRDRRQERMNEGLRPLVGSPPGPAPQVVFLVTAVFARTMSRYERMSMALIYEELGCLYQTMYLAATALGLAGCAIGRGEEMEIARWLGLDPLVESQVGCFVLGVPAGAGLT